MRHPLLQHAGTQQPATVRHVAIVVPAIWAVLAFALATPSAGPPFAINDLTSRLLATMTAALVLPSFLLASWYIVATNPLDDGITTRSIVNHVAAAAASTWIWLWIGRLGADLWGRLVDTAWPPERLFDDNRTLIFAIGVASYGIAVLGYYLLIAIEARQTEALRREELATLAKDAELRALKFQLNPHFLFNALNSISALTSSSPARARDMCVRLGDFLRRTLDLGDRRLVSLSDELDLVRDYLDLEEVRFEQRLRVEMDVADDCLSARVPPLILQPLVENAIKHGLGSLLGPMDLSLSARCGPHARLVLEVVNTFDELGAPPSAGHARRSVGLANTRQRLARQFGTDQSMSIETDNQHFRVTLDLPRHDNDVGEST